MNRQQRILLIFLDGVGLGPADPAFNPFFAQSYPFLDQFFHDAPIEAGSCRSGTEYSIAALDATLGVRGLPQSGTGQTALYTGMNAARRAGRHFGPHLYSTLKPMIEQYGLFARLERMGLLAETALANAFPQRFFDYLNGDRRRMVAGMYMAQSAGVEFRDIDSLKLGEAVSTDLTAERWKEIGHPDAPVLSPYDAGKQLASIARGYRFTLFEYFGTDKPGHEMDMNHAIAVLEKTDAFLQGVFDWLASSDILTIVTSDHGNLEDLQTKSHTRNPVPCIAFGNGHADFTHGTSSLLDITPALIGFLTKHFSE